MYIHVHVIQIKSKMISHSQNNKKKNRRKENEQFQNLFTSTFRIFKNIPLQVNKYLKCIYIYRNLFWSYTSNIWKSLYTNLGSIPCIVISFCFDSTISCVNMAWKYGILAASTILCAVNFLSPTFKQKITMNINKCNFVFKLRFKKKFPLFSPLLLISKSKRWILENIWTYITEV